MVETKHGFDAELSLGLRASRKVRAAVSRVGEIA